MDENILAVCCLWDDRLKAMQPQEDPPWQMHDAAIRTTALRASVDFRGHQDSARLMRQQHQDLPPMVGKSRWSRSRHRLPALGMA